MSEERRCLECGHRRDEHDEDGGECNRMCGHGDAYNEPYRCDCSGFFVPAIPPDSAKEESEHE